MAEDKRYNGWTNYETWNVALWIDNDQGSYNYWRDMAAQALEENENDKDGAYTDLARQLCDEIKEGAPELEASCYSDLLSAALSEVNWYEIAAHYVDEMYEEAEPEEAEEEA